MITDPSSRIALASLGWVDHGSIWRFDSVTGAIDDFLLSDADYLGLHAGPNEHFAVQHNWGTRCFRISAHHYRRPSTPLASIEVNGRTTRSSGDAAVWNELPAAYVGCLDDDATGAAGYFALMIADGVPTVHRLDWFDDSYDHGYQGVTSVVEASPGLLLYGVQRSSDLVVCEAASQRLVRRVHLAGRYGNPRPLLSRQTQRLWVVDYDTILRLDRRTLNVERQARLQPALDGAKMFVGDPWLSRDESFIVVPRPGSGDVVLLDAVSLSVIETVAAGTEPLEAAVVGAQLVGRNWKTGEHFVAAVSATRGARWRRWRGR